MIYIYSKWHKCINLSMYITTMQFTDRVTCLRYKWNEIWRSSQHQSCPTVDSLSIYSKFCDNL